MILIRVDNKKLFVINEEPKKNDLTFNITIQNKYVGQEESSILKYLVVREFSANIVI